MFFYETPVFKIETFPELKFKHFNFIPFSTAPVMAATTILIYNALQGLC